MKKVHACITVLLLDPAGAAEWHYPSRNLHLVVPKQEPTVSLLSISGSQEAAFGQSPNALQSYCTPTGESAQNLASRCGLHEGMTVKANWKDYGIYYDCTVVKVHTDGSSTVDLLYVDGFQEKGVSCDRIENPKPGPPNFHQDKSDPLCHQHLYMLVQQVQERVDFAHAEVAEYLHRRSGNKIHRYSSFGRRRSSSELKVKHDGWKHILDTPQYKSKKMMEVGKKDKEVQMPPPAPNACKEVGQQLFRKYGSAYEAVKAVDANDDTMATEKEFAHVLHMDLGNSKERSASLARGIIYEVGDRSSQTLTSQGVAACTNDAATQEVGDQLYEKYGDDSDAILSIDKDTDEQVTKGELQSALVELDNSQQEAESLSQAVMQKYDPDNEGSVPASTLVDLAEAAQPKTKKKQKAKRSEEPEQPGQQEEPGESEGLAEEKSSDTPNPAAEFLQRHHGAPGPAPTSAASPAAGSPAPPSVRDDNKAEENDEKQESKEQMEEIQHLHEELVGRDRELLNIAQRLEDEKDCFDCYGSTEFEKKLLNDKGMKSSRTSEDREAEVDILKEKISDRAEQLDELLDAASLMAAEQWLMTPAEERKADEKVISQLKLHARNIRTEAELLQEEDSNVEADKPLDPDPELRLEVQKVTQAAFEISLKIKEVAGQEEQYLHTRDEAGQGLIEFHSSIASSNDVGDSAADDNSKLVTTLESLDGEIRSARFTTHTFESDLLPNEIKWWRYRWEYSYVEAEMLVFVCFIAMIWERVFVYLKKALHSVMSKSRSFSKDYHMGVIHSQCAFLAAQEMCILLLVFITLALMKRFDIWHYWIDLQYWVAPAIHQPRTAEEYNVIGTGVTIQLALAMFFFFWHCFTLVSHSQLTLNECMDLEETISQYPGEQTFCATSSPMVKMNLVTADNYADTKKAFLRVVRRTPNMAGHLAQIVDSESNACDDSSFLLWYFIGQNIKSGIEMTARMTPEMWGFLALTFILFASLLRVMCLAWTWTYTGLAILIMLANVWMLRGIKGNVDEAIKERYDILQREDEIPTWSKENMQDVGGIGDESHFEGKANRLRQFSSESEAVDRLNQDGNICREGLCIIFSEQQNRYFLLWRSDRRHEVLEKFGNRGASSPKHPFSRTYQFSVLFLCLGASRLLFCFWMWRYYFWSVLITTSILIVAICIFQVIIVPWNIAHFVVLSFSPSVSASQTPPYRLFKLTLKHSQRGKVLGDHSFLQLDNYSRVS